MTAITLPLKKFPGQMGGQNVSLGGLWIAQPLMLIIATPIACYSVLESPQNPLIVIMVLLPFIWAWVSQLAYLMRVWRSEDRFFSSNLKDLKDLFKDSKKYYRNVILGGLITVSVSSSVSAYMYLVQGAVSPLTICVVSSVILHASMESVRRGVFDLSDVIKGVILTVVYASAALYLTRLNILLASILIALVMMKLVSSSTSFGQYELNEYLQNMVN